MGTITKADVAQITDDLRRFYLGEEGRREACGKATPQAMALLLGRLEDLTAEVIDAAKNGEKWYQQDMLADENVAGFAISMAHWQQRLAHYKRAVQSIPASQWSTREGCEALYPMVTAPLIDGIWYEILPGMNFSQEDKARILAGRGHPAPTMDRTTMVGGEMHPGGHSGTKPPDLITPFSLGNQVVVYREHQRERLQKLWDDLKHGFALPKPPGDPFDWLKWVLIIGGGVILTGVAVSMIIRSFRKSAEPEALPPAPKRDIVDAELVENPAPDGPKLSWTRGRKRADLRYGDTDVAYAYPSGQWSAMVGDAKKWSGEAHGDLKSAKKEAEAWVRARLGDA